MKHKLITITALAAALSTLASCRQEETGIGREAGHRVIALEMEDLSTKVDVADYTGICSWTAGDMIAVYVTENAVGKYKEFTVDVSGGTYHIDMTAGQGLAGYALSPSIMRDDADPAPTGATPRVKYLTAYSMSGRDLSESTFSWVPMMAVNNDERLRFYHVGGLVRIALKNVPEGTNKVVVTFDGMTHVTGTCTVTNPGKMTGAATITSGTGNSVTFTDVTRSASTMYLNVPIPTGNYSALKSITVEAFQNATSKGIKRLNQRNRWSQVRHAHGRTLTVDFNADLLSDVRLSATEAVTLWKSKTVQRTAVAIDEHGLEYPDATVVWSATPSTGVVKVDPFSGLVTAAGAGTATIRATATPSTGGAAHYAEYTVHVNAITGISVENSHKLAPGGTKAITATLINTNIGTISGYPSDLVVSWTSGTPANVTVASATTTPVKIDATHLSSTVTVSGLAEGSSTLTATVTATYASTDPMRDDDNTVICESVTTITSSTPYLFRGYSISPGFLQYDSGWSLTPQGALGHAELDGLASIMAAYGTSAARGKYYFLWTDLSESFTTSEGVITGNVVGSWRIPKKDDWDTIINEAPTSPTYLGSTLLTLGLARVLVDLTGSDLKDQGLSDSNGFYVVPNITDGATFDRSNYISGLLLIPDGATINCTRLTKVNSKTTNYNTITYDDLEILVKGGCLFFPALGYYESGQWCQAGYFGRYMSATKYGNNNVYLLYFHNSNIYPTFDSSIETYYPVRLIHD